MSSPFCRSHTCQRTRALANDVQQDQSKDVADEDPRCCCGCGQAPLEIVELDLEGPKSGEVPVEMMATGICHTDAYTLDGFDSEGIFPSVLGHEGAGVVREAGPGVTSAKPGDHVIPLYTPECRQSKSCLSGKTNLCAAIRATQGQGLTPDGTGRFSYKGQTIFHYMGCSTS